ncbi:MAG TPA: UDP-glucose 4-epimerase GalE [Bacteroidetes bacterium]|jgi:UDP-glucose 4-epimerase|nr:UDP-glucose 4-epimerase GalE [Bacteroidota bacterium]|tara:strand:+ start:4848 stop:5858 length:1011 start_codon:yes stop_codon:yes gene_type:complete
MKKILVTGGLGYIGSHTVVELQNEGYDVVVIDNLNNSSDQVQSRIESITGKPFELLVGDVNDTVALQSLFNKHSFDGVIHFAAYKAVGESVENPIMYYQNNVSGLISVLEAMNTFKVSNLIFSSSCTVYGAATDLPVTENTLIQKAESPYGTTKILGEDIIQDFAKHKAFKSILLRYFNPVGAHPSAQIGELPLGVPSNLIPFVTQTAAGIRAQLTVYGDDYATLDGTCIRDYIHVVDLAKAHVKALKYADEMTKSVDVFNVGTGNGTTVLEVIRAFENINGIKLNYKIGPRRPGDVEQIWADTSKVTEALGWKPQYGIEDMMKHAWAWQQGLTKL